MTLVQAMIERGLNRATLGAAMGVPAARVDEWITGARRIHPTLHRRLARLLGMSRSEFQTELLPSLRSGASLDDQHRRGNRLSAHICFACPYWMRSSLIRCAREQGITTSELLRTAVAATLATLNTNKGGADAGCQQCPGRKIPRRMRPTSTRLPLSPDKAQARPVSTVKSLHPRRPFSKTTNPKQGDHK